MRNTVFLILIVTLSTVACVTSEKFDYPIDFDRPFFSEPVDVEALDGMWEMSLPHLRAKSDDNNDKPCNQIHADKAYVKVVNGSVITWHYGGKGVTATMDGNGVFTFSGPSGYAYSFPGTKDKMPEPVMVTLKARITEEGSGVGSIEYVDKNEEYAVCGGTLKFTKSEYA